MRRFLAVGPAVLVGIGLGFSVGCQEHPPRPRLVLHGRPAPPPRVRSGAVLRLGRAGVIAPVRTRSGRVVMVARVGPRWRAPRWQRAVDSQGNQFRIAPDGRLVPPGRPQPEREPASVANVAYYYAQAYALMAARYRRLGLKMAAEILDLPSRDAAVRRARQSVCDLFGRLGIKGEVLRKLYRNLVAVPHRVPDGVRVQHHVHGFGVTIPLGWHLLAGRVPDLAPDATALVFSVTRAEATGVSANIVWSTSRIPAGRAVSDLAGRQLLRTRESRVSRVSPAWPPGLTGAVTFRVSPVTYQRRSLQSLQLFFARDGRLHHLNLLTRPGGSDQWLVLRLRRVLRSFRRFAGGRPCPVHGQDR